jgi:tetratricopeptide (TPR) repeat protein
VAFSDITMAAWPAPVLALAVVIQPQPTEPIARLNAWISAVQEHLPGTVDSWAAEIGKWSGVEFQELSADLAIFLWRIDQAYGLKRRTPRSARSSRPRPSNVVAAIRARAAELARDGRSPAVANEFLKRAALLHADIAMLLPAPPSGLPPPVWSAVPRSARSPKNEGIVVETQDGVVLDLQHATRHWQIGRLVLDAVVPEPEKDDTVRLWYRATVAHLQQEEKFGDCFFHLNAALEAIPGDARLLFYAGAMHEAMASGALQAAARSLESRGDVRSTVRSVEGELEEAEKFYGRALSVDPTLAEARLHYGRVIELLGRHEEAAKQLRQAISELKDSQLLYYGELFLGHEEAAMRHRQGAREHFDRAAALFPLAQSPQLALGLLARSSGDRAAALDAAKKVFALPPNEEDREDPWWAYYKAHVRDTDVLLAALRAPFITRAKP